MAAEYGCSRIPTDNSAMEDPSDAFFNVNEPSASRQWTQYPWNQAPHCDMSPISGSYTNRGIPYMMPVVSDQPAKFTKFRYEYELPLNSGIMTKLKIDNIPGGTTVHVTLSVYAVDQKPHAFCLHGLNVNPDTGKATQSRKISTPGVAEFLFKNLTVVRIAHKRAESEFQNRLMKRLKSDYLELYGQQPTAETSQNFKQEIEQRLPYLKSKDGSYSVLLGFNVKFQMENGPLKYHPTTIFTSAIANDNPLEILELAKSWDFCNGGDRIWILCRHSMKFKRNAGVIKVVFFEESYGTTRGWQAEATLKQKDIQDRLIICTAPAYHNQRITEPQKVYLAVQLIRPTESCPGANDAFICSEPKGFEYRPLPESEIYKPPQQRIRTDHLDFQEQRFYGNLPPTQTGYPGTSGGATTPAVFSHQYGYQASQAQSANEQTTERDSGYNGAHTSFDSLRDSVEKMSVEDPTKNSEKINKCFDIRNALRDYAVTGNPLSLLAPCRSLIELQDSEGNNVLHLAAWCKQANVMANFLNLLKQNEEAEAKKIVDAMNCRKETPLYLAVKHASLECTKLLLDSKANPIIIDSEGNTLAHLLAGLVQECPELYGAVLATKQNFNLLNREGFTALHLAVMRRRPKLIESLLKAGVDTSIPDRNAGRHPLHCAVDCEMTDAVELLVSQPGIEIDPKQFDSSTPLHLAVQQDYIDGVRLLMKAGADPDAEKLVELEPDYEVIENEANQDVSRYTIPKSAFDLADEHGNAVIKEILSENFTELKSKSDDDREERKADSGDSGFGDADKSACESNYN